jgi:hypothetical protein
MHRSTFDYNGEYKIYTEIIMPLITTTIFNTAGYIRRSL